MRTLGSEVSLINIVLGGLLMTALAALLGVHLYNTGLSKAETTLGSRNQAVRYFIEGYSSEIRGAVEVLAAAEDVRDAIRRTESREEALELFRSFERANEHIAYVYAGYEDGLLLIDDYTPPARYSVRDRPWYRAAMDAAPNVSTGTPYQDAIDREWLVSVGKALPACDGVVAIDSSIDRIAELLEDRGGGYESSYSFVADHSGTVLIHHEGSYVNRPLREIIDGDASIESDSGRFQYALDNVEKTAVYSRIDEVGWVVVTVVEEREILRPTVRSIGLVVSLIVLATALVTSVQISVLRRRFVRPVLELHRRVRSIVNGGETQEAGYAFPRNEIGATASEVTRLAEREHRLSARSERRFSILMIDVDHFKTINDGFGHQAGDAVIERIGEVLRETIRSTDIPGRWGGEEFLILCPETDLSGAASAAESVRAAIESAELAIPESVTVSVGASELAHGESVTGLVSRTDEKLYAAKAKGRNRVVA
ncbi:MAG: diguanylate cyclase [Spirochaetota bacterium]